MFGLLKLAVYGLMGYALFEFFVGLTSGQERSATVQSRQRKSGIRNTRQGTQGAAGHGQPIPESTYNPDGGRASHNVGRGVVQR